MSGHASLCKSSQTAHVAQRRRTCISHSARSRMEVHWLNSSTRCPASRSDGSSSRSSWNFAESRICGQRHICSRKGAYGCGVQAGCSLAALDEQCRNGGTADSKRAGHALLSGHGTSALTKSPSRPCIKHMIPGQCRRIYPPVAQAQRTRSTDSASSSSRLSRLAVQCAVDMQPK